RLAWFFNLRDRIPGARAISEKLVGVSAKRSLPRWRSDTFFRDQGARSALLRGEGREVALFVDTFNNYFEPEHARAALRGVEAAGHRVTVLGADDGRRPLCCGRTFLAAGLVDEAKAEARRTLAALAPLAVRGVPIVGLEPSCLFSFRDEYQVMGLGAEAKAA